jgi:outer membrane protein TolC
MLRQGQGTAREAVLLARARYESGNSILTEVLDAELEAITVEQRQVQAAYDLAVAHLDRLHAEGWR